MDLFDRLDDVAARWDVLRHPFYTRWSAGELTRRELAFYAGEYRHLVGALARTATCSADPRHAAEERDHVALWDGFARAVSADVARPPRPETEAAARAWTREGPEGLAVLYAVESAQPAIARTKLNGLVDHYGFDRAGDAAAYFRVHATLDEEHAASAREELGELHLADDDSLVAAAEDALRGNWELLDGVEREFAAPAA